MATVKLPLDIGAASFQTTHLAAPILTQGTDFPVPGLAFDAADNPGEAAFWIFRIPNYGSGNLTLDFTWYADTASSGDAKFDATIAAITPDTDTQDVETKSFATVTTVTDTHLGTTGQRVHKAAITISNLDSVAADDLVSLRFRRLGNDAADTMTGDAIVTELQLSYSDT